VTNVLLVAVEPDLAARISMLDGHRVVALDRHNAAELARTNNAGPSFDPGVILIGSDIPREQAIDYATCVLAEHPAIAVFLVTSSPRRLGRAAVKAGIRGVVPPTIRDQDLREILNGPAQVSDGDATTRHQVIVVVSPKGGVGKTTTAVNLSGVLAKSSPRQVVLIDLDLQFGDVTAVLDLQPEHTITDAFDARRDDSMLLRTLLTEHPAGFFVLAGAGSPAENAAVSGEQVRKLISQLSASFCHVVIDTSAGLLEETLSSLEEATDVVLVAALDVATLRSARKELEVLTDLELLPAAVHVVLNKADRRTGLTVRDAVRVLGVDVDAVVPRSDRISLAANHGTIAALATKRSDVRKPFEILASTLCDPVDQQHLQSGANLS